VAAEPLIVDPVDIEFNERGDALVLEMPGYPFGDQQSRIVVLQDKNADGIYDDKTVFVEGLQLANSFMPYQKGILVAAPPYLLFVRDDDQNYVPDRVDTLMGGFSTGNLQHNYNGLTYGLDNWIYAANGGNDGAPYWWNDTTTRMDLHGQDFRFHLKSKTMERLGESSGGHGITLDEYGRVFETHNMEHISHLVFPDRYISGQALLMEHTLENISDHEEHGTSRIYPIGEQEARVNHPEQSGYFSGACGIMYYGGGAFGPDYNHTVWIADVVLNLVHVDKLQPNGASFTASRMLEKRDFLAGTDRSFRPVNMTVGPDGNIYLVDMYRKVIEHPEWIPDDIEKTLDLHAGKDQGRIYRINKTTGSKIEFDVAQFNSERGLVANLSHPNQWVRNTAHRLLSEKPASSETIDALKTLLVGEHEYAKLHAVYLLSLNDALSEADLFKLLADKNPAIQELALLQAEKFINANASLVNACLPLLRSDNARVSMQAGLSLSRVEAGSEIYQEIARPLFDALLETAKTEQNDWVIAALTLAAKDRSAQLFEELVRFPRTSGNLPASLALQAGRTEHGARTILKSLPGSYLTSGDQKLILKQLIKNANPAMAKSLESLIDPLERSGNVDLLADLAALRNKLKLPESPVFLKYSQEALKQVSDASLPDSVRIRQLELIDFLPYPTKADALFTCLKNNQPAKIQEGALRQLANYPEKEIGTRLVAIWSELSPQTRRYAGDLLLHIEMHHDALLTGLENGAINIGEMNFDLERRRQLLWWTDDENTKRRAGKLFSDSGVTNRREAIDKMKPALSLDGAAANGMQVFDLVCGNCHQFGTRGKEVGPTLTDIGRKSKETLLHDILDPNAAADPQYINHRLETNAGSVHLGIVAAETDQAITIKKMGGESVVVNKAEVKSFRSLGTSLMMEGLENTITVQEMADLLAFLQDGNLLH
jgi:putative membrane-bound dehydrogenase-like protein